MKLATSFNSDLCVCVYITVKSNTSAVIFQYFFVKIYVEKAANFSRNKLFKCFELCNSNYYINTSVIKGVLMCGRCILITAPYMYMYLCIYIASLMTLGIDRHIIYAGACVHYILNALLTEIISVEHPFLCIKYAYIIFVYMYVSSRPPLCNKMFLIAENTDGCTANALLYIKIT